ncbi:hypothetical protein [Kingella oralis]|nr:hypothetical protein [Kingella oralis]
MPIRVQTVFRLPQCVLSRQPENVNIAQQTTHHLVYRHPSVHIPPNSKAA